jgi:hypothetical protein
VHLFRPSLSFLAEAQPKLENSRGQKTLFAEVHIKFLSDRTNYNAKDIVGKMTNLFCILILFSNMYINTFINTY